MFCTVLYCIVLYCTVQAGGWGMKELRVFPGCETPGNLFIDAGDTQQEENGGTEQVTDRHLGTSKDTYNI